MAIRAILFDVIGTTVLENQPDVIFRCFRAAFLDSGVDVSSEDIRSIRGRDKKAAISKLLLEKNSGPQLANAILQSFKDNFASHLDLFYEHPELKDLIVFLRSKNILIGIGSGLPQDIFEMLFDNLKWHKYKFDYVSMSEKIGKSRPDPAMIFDMMRQCRIISNEFLKVGDTPSDVEEGKNAGVKTAAVLSGTSSAREIELAKPDYVINNLSEVKLLI
jgi:phosphonoacetaldehyde hydrolase